MEPLILDELRSFFLVTGCTQASLSARSGVAAAHISRLLSGKHQDIRSAHADALRIAMREILAADEVRHSMPRESHPQTEGDCHHV